MDLVEIAHGLWRWTARHPEWTPGAEPGSPADWEPDVGSVLYEAPGAAVFIDPLLPAQPAQLIRAIDRRVRKLDRVVVLTTIRWHRRSRDAFVDRYRATTSRARRQLPAGVEVFSIPDAREVVFWLPELQALVPGDTLVGDASSGLRLCPESWLRALPSEMTRPELAQALRPLLDLPVELVLTSHGPPVLAGGRRALARAVTQAQNSSATAR
jgi:glyoxylase-like metal-dependent hydrolase (beta-lactamase superfamily II)